MYAIRLGSLLD